MIQDFKNYLSTVQIQYLQLKEDLKDFDEAFKNGYITEDRLTQVKEELDQVEINYNRLLYVDYLLGIPSRKKKKYLKRADKRKQLRQLKRKKADEAAVIAENDVHKENIHNALEKLISTNK